MRHVVRNSFARQSILSERIRVSSQTCSWCGSQRHAAAGPWLSRFHVSDDSGSRHSGPVGNGRLFCSRDCAEAYIGRPFDETA